MNKEPLSLFSVPFGCNFIRMSDIGQSSEALKGSRTTASFQHEENRPFPKMAPSPTPSSDEAAGTNPSSRENSWERDSNNYRLEDPEFGEAMSPSGSGVHPGEGGIFNLSPNEGGPVRLTNLKPISPTNEDVYSSSELRNNPQPAISVRASPTDKSLCPQNTFLQVYSPSRPGAGYANGPLIIQSPIFSMQENEKYRKLLLKKQKRISKKEKNVKSVFKAEDIEGHNGEMDMSSILQSMGLNDDKKGKVKRSKEKSEKQKTDKRERSRKSVDKDTGSKSEDTEDVDDIEDEFIKPVKTHRNQVEEDLVFKNNCYLVTPEPGPLARHKSRDCLAGSAESLNSPNTSFTKVTNKKHRAKRSRDDTGKPPPDPPAPDGRRSGYVQRSRDTYNSASRENVLSPTEPFINKGEPKFTFKESDEINTSDIQIFPKLEKDEFPALPGVGVSQTPVLLSAWTKAVTKSSDNPEHNKCIVSKDNEVIVDIESVPDTVNSPVKQGDPEPKAHEASDLEAVIDCDVPSDSKDQNDSVFVSDLVESEVNDSEKVPDLDVDINKDTLNDYSEDDTSAVDGCISNRDNIEVITSEDEFNKRKADNSAPVVILSEKDQDWTSAEFTFGFDVNEDLVANTCTHPPPEPNQQPSMWTMPTPVGPLTPIDTVDGAILSFGGPETMRMIVPVAVGVPVPVSMGELGEHIPQLSFYPPQYPNGPVIPSFRPFDLSYSHPLGAQSEVLHHSFEDKTGIDTEKDAEDNIEDQTISPESGISSSSPLSWQPDSSPSLPAPGAYPHAIEGGRDTTPLVSQVSQSLSNWQGHSVHSDASDSDRSSPTPGWATQVEVENNANGDETKESGEKNNDSGLASETSITSSGKEAKVEQFNLGEIVNFISSSWSSVSQDSSVAVFSAASHSHKHTDVVA